MSSSTIAFLVAISAFIAIAIAFARQWRATSAQEARDVGKLHYRGEIRLMIRRSPSGVFILAKNGSGRFDMRVRGDEIAIRSRGFPRRLAAALGLDYTLEAKDLEVGLASMNRFGHPSGDRPFVAVHTQDKRGWLDMAIFPFSGDLSGVRERLLAAGAKAAPEEDPLARNHGLGDRHAV